MGNAIAWILGIATVLGGIAAIGYFLDKWHESKQWIEKEKEINSAWWEASELKKHLVANGYTDFGWSNPDRLAERISEGKEVVCEVDEKNSVKYKLVNKSGQVLVGRKNA